MQTDLQYIRFKRLQRQTTAEYSYARRSVRLDSKLYNNLTSSSFFHASNKSKTNRWYVADFSTADRSLSNLALLTVHR